MRISDWSSDVCSSELVVDRRGRRPVVRIAAAAGVEEGDGALPRHQDTDVGQLPGLDIAAHPAGAPRPAVGRAAENARMAGAVGETSEEPVVGREWFRTCVLRWSPIT